MTIFKVLLVSLVLSAALANDSISSFEDHHEPCQAPSQTAKNCFCSFEGYNSYPIIFIREGVAVQISRGFVSRTSCLSQMKKNFPECY